ncbi:SDR family NAD(P)-dependent oxidoreductase [Acidisoma sp. S159]|jgi:2-dehydro-3-deoxy-D-gluconate 5-dehydrogenase|uniref:SDR family NAD(P)-dependent oxidoreductase n=1 Tax=Acidisoma sp. S159 TaxID=1747225 RepID=UPI00131D1E63|nr:glucose 1-dehydrogenase [Acidisoma sp. S159]
MPHDRFDLRGRVAIVTGGNGGIGLAMARGLAQAGADVVLSGRDAAKGAEARGAVEEFGGRVSFVTADLSRPEDCLRLVEDAKRSMGRVDILINNAGIVARHRPEDLNLAEWQSVIATNLTSAFLCAQNVYPAMKGAGGGKIINIGSMLSLFGASFGAAYGASKGGLVQLTRSLAVAWAADNIQVNAILPGWIDTAMGASARSEVQDLEGRVIARTPAGRWGKPDDMVGIAVFLASAASDFVTGAAIPVDGGYSIAG